MSVATALRGVAGAAPTAMPFGPTDMFSVYTGIEVPDPITFVVGERWLNRPNLYPRQATLIKIIFLREDLFTAYDYDVVEEWEQLWRDNNGHAGLAPGVLEKMRFLQALGHKWFREVLLVMGRRAGKGHVTALCMAYVLWNYMAKGDPQDYYGVDRDKQLVALIFAGKRDQAKANVFGDLANVITGSTCFAPFIHNDHVEKLSIFAPHDFVRMRKQQAKGLKSERDPATFALVPRESTVMAGRGPTSFMHAYDEMAHLVAAGANRSAEEVYGAAKPSLDQFGKDAFIMEPSSPWQMLGQFYENWLHANEIDEETGEFVYPDMLSLQLASWDIYIDWERTDPESPAYLPLFPDGFLGDLGEYDPEYFDPEQPPGFRHLRGAIQVYDDQMRREEKANPDTFKVERLAQWAAALDAYLNETKVKEIFGPWRQRPEEYGPPDLQPKTSGLLVYTYKGHGDPSLSNANFGFALAHGETDASGLTHCVFDMIHHWEPGDWADNIVDYEEIEDWLWNNVVTKFYPEELTFDQWNSASTIQKLNKRVRHTSMPKRVQVFEKTATRDYNWSRAETTKKAINLGWVHAPAVTSGRSYEQAELEMRFLQSPRPGVVEHPTSGPIQTKDVADCVFECVMTIIGEQANNFTHSDLNNFRPGGAMQGGMDPAMSLNRNEMRDDDRMAALSSFGRSRGRPGVDQTGVPQRPRGGRRMTRHRS